MQSSYQARVEANERALASYREAQFRGSARVRLDCLDVEDDFQIRMDNQQNVPRLEQIMELQGCLRLSPKYHVNVQIDAGMWERQMTLRRAEDGQFPELIVPLGYRLVVEDHWNLIQAARRRLAPLNQWWVVDIYVNNVTDQSSGQQFPNQRTLQSQLSRDLREKYINEKRPPDGLIYQKIRYYQGYLGGQRDPAAENDWWAILQSAPRTRKPYYVKYFLQHGSLPQKFDALLRIPGLWAAMQIGSLHKILALRCDEEILSYLDLIERTWTRILGGDEQLMAQTDAKTVDLLQSRAPAVSETDRLYLRSRLEDGSLFPAITDDPARTAIWGQLQELDYVIPTLHTFFKDVHHLIVAKCVMQHLYPPEQDLDPKLKPTVDQGVAGRFRTSPAGILASRRPVAHGLHELWRYSMQNGFEITSERRRSLPPKRRARRRGPLAGFAPSMTAEGAATEDIDAERLLKHFFWLADELGFNVPEVPGLKPQRHEFLSSSQAPAMPADGSDEVVQRRCGRPYEYSALTDRLALSRDELEHRRRREGRVTTGFVRQCVFAAFFEHLAVSPVSDMDLDLPSEGRGEERAEPMSVGNEPMDFSDPMSSAAQKSPTYGANDPAGGVMLTGSEAAPNHGGLSPLFQQAGARSGFRLVIFWERHKVRKFIWLPKQQAQGEAILANLHNQGYRFSTAPCRGIHWGECYRFLERCPKAILRAGPSTMVGPEYGNMMMGRQALGPGSQHAKKRRLSDTFDDDGRLRALSARQRNLSTVIGEPSNQGPA